MRVGDAKVDISLSTEEQKTAAPDEALALEWQEMKACGEGCVSEDNDPILLKEAINLFPAAKLTVSTLRAGRAE